MSTVISIYSTKEGEGKTTIATAITKILGQTNQSVLYVELDAVKPSLAITTGITHPTKNLLNYMLHIKDEGKLKADDFISSDETMKLFPKTVKFLSFPIDYDIKTFPALINEDNTVFEEKIQIRNFSKLIVDQLKQLADIVIFILPHEIGDLFTIPFMLESDLILNIVTTNQKSLSETRKAATLLADIEDLNMKEKWRVVINKFVTDIPMNQLENILVNQEIVGTVMNDHGKIVNDLKGVISSDRIDHDVTKLLQSLQLIEITKRKGLFGGRSR